MTTTVVSSTERGQITLPKKWRDAFATDTYALEMHNDRLIIVPIDLKKAIREEVIFDADRDNDGVGISPEEMIRELKKIRHG